MANCGGSARRGLRGVGTLIFATVGTQLPFPRFINALDAIAARRGLHVVAQTCDPGARPKTVEAHVHLPPARFDALIAESCIIVGHAGMGTILCAMRARKPVILFPRRAALNEHRNDHQLATVAGLRDRTGVNIAEDEAELEGLLTRSDLTPATFEEHPTRRRLIAYLRNFLDTA